MKWIIVGLGNPGGAYSSTRHNAGRIVVEYIRDSYGISEWVFDKKTESMRSKGLIENREFVAILPETFMNESGRSLMSLIKSPADARNLIVVHDDIDLPLGTWKISFDRGSGGQKGVESIMTVLKTREFIRIRVGVLPRDEEGKVKKPKGEEAVVKFVLGKFREEEGVILERVQREISDALPMLVTQPLELVMTKYNEKR